MTKRKRYQQIGYYPVKHLPCDINNVIAVCPQSDKKRAVNYDYDTEFVEFMYKDILNYGGLTWAHDRAFQAFYQPAGTMLKSRNKDSDCAKIYYVISGPNRGMYAADPGVKAQDIMGFSTKEDIICVSTALKFLKDNSPQDAQDVYVRVLYGCGVVGAVPKTLWEEEFKIINGAEPAESSKLAFAQMYEQRLKEDVKIIKNTMIKLNQRGEIK